MNRTSYLTLCLVAVSLLVPVATQAQSKSGQASPTAHQLAGPTAPDEAHRKAADAILQQIWKAQPGQPKFDAIDAVVQKYKQSDAATQYAIAWLCLTYMKDQSRAPLDRWPCEYVLSRVAYQPAVSELINVLLHDQLECMRAVAAEALGSWWKSTGSAAMHDALLKASQTDSSQWVRDTIARYLGNTPPKQQGGQPH